MPEAIITIYQIENYRNKPQVIVLATTTSTTNDQKRKVGI
jgi:CRISPR/Cas system-associated endonuclease/helicase Cas3